MTYGVRIGESISVAFSNVLITLRRDVFLARWSVMSTADILLIALAHDRRRALVPTLISRRRFCKPSVKSFVVPALAGPNSTTSADHGYMVPVRDYERS